MIVAGRIAAGTVLCLILGTLAVVFLNASGPAALGPADWAALRFTLLQAALSAAISVAAAIPVARALARRRFPGRAILVTLLGVPFILPVIVAIMGLLAVFGRNGIVNVALGALGLPEITIYGLHGVVLAHVFFNMPLAVRLILAGWLEIPAERFRLAASLGMGPAAIRRQIEWPMLARVAPGALTVIFLICLTSFAVALTLGGGPRATTIELAIYQAFRFDVDLGRAALLALVQLGLTAAAAYLALRLSVGGGAGPARDRRVERWDASGPLPRIADAAWLILAAIFLLVPLGMVVGRGLPGLADLPGSVLPALARSLFVAGLSVVLTMALALPMALAAARTGGRWVEGSAYVAVAASPLVLGTGLFLLVFPVMDPARLALPVTALVNALLTLPFATRALVPPLRGIEADYGRLADSLGMVGLSRLRYLILPRLRRPMGFSAGLAAAFSMGDLGVIALFADGGRATLPLEIFRLMSAYRLEAAAAGSLLLLAATVGVFALFDRGARLDA